MPNAGKSTLFNALTLAGVPAESFPFCTIEPNVGTAVVPDTRLQAIAETVGVANTIPAVIDFVDIAGLVKGASQGEGLGNRFLAHIREMDLIAHVVGAFGKDSDPRSDADVVNLELILADLETVVKASDKATRRARTGDRDQAGYAAVLARVQGGLEQGVAVRDQSLDLKDKASLGQLHLITDKPVFYVVNVDEDEAADSSILSEFELDAPAVQVCAELESELAQLTPEDQHSFREELGIDDSALGEIVRCGYRMLGLRTFFTFNESEVRAWVIPKGTTAQQAAGRVHTDMEQGFIRAEVMSWEDLVSCGSESAVKMAGKVRFEGKSYEPGEGEIIRIRFNS